MSIKITRIVAGLIVAAAFTAADPEARYLLWPGDEGPAATAQLRGTR